MHSDHNVIVVVGQDCLITLKVPRLFDRDSAELRTGLLPFRAIILRTSFESTGCRCCDRIVISAAPVDEEKG